MENKTQTYKEPEIEIIHMTETDILTTSGDGFLDIEGELMLFDLPLE